jgi:hypothetical protein
MSSPIITVSSIIEDAKSLSFVDLLALQTTLATLIKGEFKKVSKATKVPKVVDPSKPKRKLSQGVVTWQAFVKDLVVSQPDLFIGAKVTARQTIAKEYRAANPGDYDAFKAKFEGAGAESPVVSDVEAEVSLSVALKAESPVRTPVEPKAKGRAKKVPTK